MTVLKSESTFQRIVALRFRLEDALEAGEPTLDIREAIWLLEDQILQERAEENRAAHLASRDLTSKASERAAALAEQAKNAITRLAANFSLNG